MSEMLTIQIPAVKNCFGLRHIRSRMSKPVKTGIMRGALLRLKLR